MSYATKSISVTPTSPTTANFSWSVTGATPPSWNWAISGSTTISNSSGSNSTTSGSGSGTITNLTPGASYTWTLTLSGGAGAGTATASATMSEVTITWDLAGGTGGGSYPTSTTLGVIPNPSSTPTRSGYVFNGWSPNLPVSVTTNTTVTAQWNQLWSISYNLAGGTGGSGYTTTMQNGGTVPAPSSNPTLSGKTFYAWSPALPYSNITGNMTFTALWTPSTVTWNYNGGSGSPPSTSVSYGATTTTPSTSQTNYTFNSWSASNGDVLGQGATTSAITGDITYTANWTYSPPPPPPNPSPTWSDNALAAFTISTAYSDGVTANNMSGYSGTYSVSAGTLPAGISLNTSTGAVTGTPTTVSTYNFTITATNVNGSISQNFTGTVLGGVAVATGSTWYKATVSVYNGSAWVAKPLYVYNGTSWVLSS